MPFLSSRNSRASAASSNAKSRPSNSHMPKPQKQHAADDIECGDSPVAHSAPALRAPSKPSEELLGRVSDDLTSKMRAWAQQIDAQYMHVDDPATHSLRVSVLAATGIEHVAAPFWLAAVSGSVAETAEPTPLAEPMTPGGSPPAGTPSWQAEALTLRVHDVTADLLLFLCEADGTDASRACVGRVVVPLTELLPRLPCVGQPPPRRFWAEIFPAAPEYALGQVRTTDTPLHALLSPSRVGSAHASCVRPTVFFSCGVFARTRVSGAHHLRSSRSRGRVLRHAPADNGTRPSGAPTCTSSARDRARDRRLPTRSVLHGAAL
jgi:hypothetical protein